MADRRSIYQARVSRDRDETTCSQLGSSVRWHQENRRAPAIRSSFRLIAFRTWLGSYFAEVQAEPLEISITPLRVTIAASASTPGIDKFTAFGTTWPISPLMTGRKGDRCSRSRLRKSVFTFAHRLCSRVASSAARPRPTIKWTGSVPGLRPLSWPPHRPRWPAVPERRAAIPLAAPV